MALQVWLPLNGNLNNQGLSNVTVTNSGATVNSAGKIGSCYAFTESQYMVLNNVPFSQLGNCSVCFWIYLPSNESWLPCTGGNAGSNTGQYFLATEGGTGAFYHSNIGSNTKTIYRDGVVGTTPLASGAWHHYCITGLDLSTWTGITINHYGSYSGWNFNGRLNDFRIYDHCLSPKEVKEISKGLVLHYKLDEGSLKGSGNLVTRLSGGGQCTISGSTVTVSGTNADTYFYIHTSTALTSGKTYRISCTGNFADGKYYDFPIAAQANTGPGMIRVQNGYCSMVFIANDTIANAETTILMDDKNRAPGAGTISNITLEEVVGVYDCSGYGRNGVMNAAATMVSSTSRYREATHLPGAGNIYCASFPFVFEYLTFSVWAKLTTLKQLIDARNSSGVGYQPLYVDVGIETGSSKTGWADFYGDNMRYRTGEWIHYAIVLTPTSSNVFVNGEQYASGASSTGGTYNFGDLPIYLFSRYTNTNNITGDISDFRIYSTALSADDIKDLYQTSAAIHNTGNIEAFEFVEINNLSRELNPFSYANGSSAVYLPNGDFQMKGYVWPSSDYIPINPVGKTYYYDIEYSNSGGGHLYIGFEKYDANKQSGSNAECQYMVSTTGTYEHARVTGTINLSTANGNTAAYTRLRLLNNWEGGGTVDTRIGTIHYVSLKEVATKTTTDIQKTGVINGDTFIESKDASISHTGNVVGNQIIEI